MQSGSGRSSEVNKFYDRIRSYLRDSSVDFGSSVGQSKNHTSPKKPKSKKSDDYGDVSKDVLDRVLKSYDEQQSAKDGAIDRPVSCLSIAGNNYANSLHSCPGFHNVHSTNFLVKDLGINDINRYTFLGGLSSFVPPKGQILKDLKNNYIRFILDQHVCRAFEYLDKCMMDSAQVEVINGFKIDPKNADLHGVLGACFLHSQRYEEAIEKLRISLDGRPKRSDQVIEHLAEAYFNRGMTMYHKEDYRQAIELYTEALRYNRNHDGASLHKNMCESYITNTSGFYGKRSQTYRR